MNVRGQSLWKAEEEREIFRDAGLRCLQMYVICAVWADGGEKVTIGQTM